MTFSNFPISSKVYVIPQHEFEHVYCDVAVQHLHLYPTENPLLNPFNRTIISTIIPGGITFLQSAVLDICKNRPSEFTFIWEIFTYYNCISMTQKCNTRSNTQLNFWKLWQKYQKSQHRFIEIKVYLERRFLCRMKHFETVKDEPQADRPISSQTKENATNVRTLKYDRPVTGKMIGNEFNIDQFIVHKGYQPEKHFLWTGLWSNWLYL